MSHDTRTIALACDSKAGLRRAGVGEWRSPVARLLWEQDVAGSNPVSPTIHLRLQYFPRRGLIWRLLGSESAIVAPRSPIGRGRPVVVSIAVWRSASALISAPISTA